MQKLIFIYFIAINIVSFIVFAFDKLMAKMDKRRISEQRLHFFTMIGGFIGSSISMILFSHKVSKPTFFTKHLVIVLFWIIGVVIYFTQIDELNFLL